MKRWNSWVVAAVAVGVIITAAVAWKTLGQNQPEAAPPPPSALITVAPVRAATIDDTVNAYGVIAGSAAASRTLSAPRAVIVQRLLVAPGQPVAAGSPLVVLVNTPASDLAYRQASDALNFAQRDLTRVQRLFDEHLAANDQLGAARKAVADAQAGVAAQAAAGAGGGSQTLPAPFAGVVGAVSVAAGQNVAADAPLLTVIANGGLIAQLGVEPTRAKRLATGQAVMLGSPLDPARKVSSHLAIVGRAVDPASRLVEVTAPAQETGLPLGSAVGGEITVASHPGLLAPRASVMFDEKGAHVFVIRAGKAHETTVTAGAEQGGDIELSGPIAPGDQVAVQGAYQLEDGLAVRTARR